MHTTPLLRTSVCALMIAVLAGAAAFSRTPAGGQGNQTPAAPGGAAVRQPSPEASAPNAADRPEGGKAIVGESARWNEEGIRQTRARHFNEAIDAFKKAIDADKRQPILWNNLGSVYLTVSRLYAAEGAFKQALKLDPNFALAHYNLGAAYDANLDYEGAIESYARALELDPKLGDASYNPPVVNNSKMTEVHLLLYKRQAGALGAPLTSVRPKGTR